MIASYILLGLLSSSPQDEDKWQTLAPKASGFAVELPPGDRQQSDTPFIGPGGAGTLHQILIGTEALYCDLKGYECQRPIAKADEKRWIDWARDKEAGFGSHGKLVAEKNMKLGNLVGREFTLDGGSGKFEARGRAFVKGSTVYVLVASSRKGGKPLPPDADRFLESFTFGAKPSDAGKAAAKAGQEAEDRRKGAVPWKVVKLLGDKATVEMPGETAMTGGGNLDEPLSRFFCMSTNAEGVGVDYSALAFQGENGLAAKDEMKALEVARQRAVYHFGTNAKVVSERPIATKAGSGREYEMTIERRPGVTVQAQCRSYVHGGAILMVIAVSKAKDKALPPETVRFLDSLEIRGQSGEVARVAPPGGNNPSVGALIPILKLILGPTKTSLIMGLAQLGVSRSMGNRPPGVIARTNPPEPGGNMPPIEVEKARPAAKPAPVAAKPIALKAWGTKIDPDGDVGIEASGRSLKMEIPGTAHLLAPEREKMNAPRVTAPVQGDLTVVVRVDGAFHPNPKSTVKGLSTRQAGGLIVWKDSRNYLVFQHRASVDDGKVVHHAVLEELVGGEKGVTHRQAIPEGSTFLRLERRRGRISAAFSANGKDWKEMKPVDTTWATGEVEVGVVGVNSSIAPHEITFEGYTLKAK